MKSLLRKISSILFDPRVLVGLGGIILGIVMHELLHVIMHWGDIERIGIFPDRHAIFEIIFEPSVVYDLAIEEGFAYTVTMATFILTAMLINDINEARDKRSVRQIILTGKAGSYFSDAQKKKSLDSLARLLGLKVTANKVPSPTKKKGL